MALGGKGRFRMDPSIIIANIPNRVRAIETGRLMCQCENEFKEIDKVVDAQKDHYINFTAADKNPTKNNNCEYVPFDYNRVVLKQNFECESDYINASSIKWSGDALMMSHPKRYITTQSVDKNGIIDFWKMVWQENVSIIVMLTPPNEKGMENCGCYFPKVKTKTLYDMTYEVRNKCELINSNYTKRTLTLKNKSCPRAGERIISHFHYKKWPRDCVPSDPFSLFELLEEVRQTWLSLEDSSSTVVVQSYEGVGRAGTFIAADMAMDFVEKNTLQDCIDLQNIVTMMRKQRLGLIKNFSQYFLYHQLTAVFVQMKQKDGHKENSELVSFT